MMCRLAIALLLVSVALWSAPAAAQTNTFTVTNFNSSGSGSLTQAVLSSNATSGTNTIRISVSGQTCSTSNPCRIRPSSTLTITRAVTIDASTQSGWVGTPVVWIDGSSASPSGSTVHGFDVQTSGVTIKEFTISQWTGAGVRLTSGSGNTVTGNFIGANAIGVLVEAATSGNSITGNDIGLANGYSSNGYTANTSHGVVLRGTNNTVGGTSSTVRNVIRGNGGNGVWISGSGNTVAGNYIGTDGTGAYGNSGAGVYVFGAASTTIGGSSSASRNVIGANGGDGVYVTGDSGATVITSNYIGTNSAGSGRLANGGSGIDLNSTASITVGGAGVGNVVSGNTSDGITVDSSSDVSILANYVGANAAGSGTVTNGGAGIRVQSSPRVTIGGTGLGNLIGGNTGDGISATGSANATILANYVGVNVAGTGALANGGAGIRISGSANATIGGRTSGEGNLVGGNTSHGIVLTGSGTTGAAILGNTIGANVSNSGTIANSGSGINIAAGASSNTIGGTNGAAANVIRGNAAGGITFTSTGGVPLYDRISGNSIFANTGLGIRLQNSGTTALANDGAKSASASNQGMDSPVFTSAQLAGSALYVAGYVGSASGQATFAGARVEVFRSDNDASGYGEGQTYLGSLYADANGAFAGTFNVSGVAAGDRLTATATDASSNSTSEFGANAQVASATSVPASGPIAEWRFEETAWTGAAGEVKDSTANGIDLTSYGNANTALPTGGAASCRYGVFGGNLDRVGTSTETRLDPSTTLTVMAWVYARAYPSELMTIVSKDENYEFHLTPDGQINWWWGGDPRALTTTGTAIALNKWYHVAITYTSGAQRIYIDGVLRGSNNQTGTLTTSGAPFLIGADVSTSATYDLLPGRTWNGYIDNVRIYDRTLSQSEVQTAMTATMPCGAGGVTGYVITTSNQGLYCLDHSVTVTPVDANGNAVSTYTGTMNLTTSTARGTWLLQTGSGTLVDAVADDGAASYTFPGSQSSVTFWLRYRTGGAVVNVDAAQSGSPTIRDSDTEGSITFSPSGFTVTSTPISAPVTSIPAFTGSMTAGTNQPVYLTAYGQTPTDATCGVIAGYTGAKQLKFWLTRSDPATGTVSATVNATTIASAEASSAAQAVTFSSGQASVTLKYKDVGRISLSMKDDTTGNASLPTGIRGSTGSFVSKPADFTVSNVKRTTDNVANPGTTTAGGTVFLAAGRPFTATVTAVDAEGSTTPNYGRESAAESVRFTTTLVLPASGAAPAVTGSFGAFSSGSAIGTAFAWNEVGTMRLVPRVFDGDYLAAGDVVGTASSPVGRFVPDRFEVAQNTPLFQTGCTAGGFTYVGQPFVYSVAPVITATAVALGGTATTNYTGSLFRLTNATIGAPAYAASGYTLDVSGLPASGADPAIVDAGGGVARLTYSAGTGIALARTTPVAPFVPAITLTDDVVDADGVRAAASVVFGAGSGILFTTGATQRYGRLTVRSAAGSELLDLPVRTVVQHWLDAARGFTTASDDQCTAAPAITLRDWKRNLSAGETCVRDSGSPGASGAGCPAAAPAAKRYRSTASSGDFNLVLAAPGAGNSGAVTVEAVAPAWLKYDWVVGTVGLENPSALATFGVFQGSAQRVYEREVY
jgi:MSHA biogenesis protein MshQ